MHTILKAAAKKHYRQLAPLFLRITIGFGFMAHGYAKLGRGPETFAKLLTILHVPFPTFTAWLTTFVEILGGFALFIGVFTTVAVIPMMITMLVAMFTIHIHYGFSAVKTIGLTPTGPLFGPPGYEINLLYIGGLVSLILTGAGKFSIDAWFAKNKTN